MKRTQEKTKKMKENNVKGITLIALVVTIVVLLILAGITVNMLFSNGGIFETANQAKIEYEIGALKDRINNVIADWSIERAIDKTVTVDDLWDKMVEADIIDNPDEDVAGPEKKGENDRYELTTNEGYIVEIIISPEGNVNIGDITKGEGTGGEKDDEIGGATEGLKEGNIIASDPIWSDGTASITLSKGTEVAENLSIQYQIGGVAEENWTTGTQVTGLHHNDTVYARLTDGVNTGKEASVVILDDIPPVISNFVATSKTYNSITVTVTANDEQTGLATDKTYQYYLGNETEPKSISVNPTYTFSGLVDGTEYTLKVIVTDNAGLTEEKSITVTTNSYPTITSKLKAGNYVNYIDKNRVTRKCVVLYDNSSGYGIQIITMESLENVNIGNDTGSYSSIESDFNTAMTSYNYAISTLNSKASNYLNTTYASNARCVGSLPNNKNSQSNFHTFTQFTSAYDGKLRDGDNNYTTDDRQMTTLKIDGIGSEYWLASRKVSEASDICTFGIRTMSESGLNSYIPCGVYSSGSIFSNGCTSGLRAVFTLKPEIKVVGGSGTFNDPYKLST